MRVAGLAVVALALALAAAGCSRGGAPFDQQLVDMMVTHHQGAIDAAKAAETRAQRSEVKQLAGEIAAAQQREIEQMRQWRRAWYGS
jgi:uncharacterized protein (DUF305 family)